MQNVRAIQATSRHGVAEAPETWLRPDDPTGTTSSSTTVPLSTGRPGRHMAARDLHPGDVVQQCDWLLHVRAVDVSEVAVAIVVTEFEFKLHYGADTQVSLAA